MSFCGSKSDARAAIASVELSDTTGSGGTSPIRSGASGPGGAAAKAKPAGQTLSAGSGRANSIKPKTATESLRRSL